ncbi:GLPGLI family protein [Myroides marinus]|uniref:GLPGLI family protein n=1 Tax=Myroides marinus TaxID=703342 RepID=UPI002578AB8F|nr:GLPGLI family protein [Myroides marinus]MDM1389500.1 GLPGLI family protein [Myroides marinus]
MKKYLFMLLITATSLAQSKDVEVMRYNYKTSIANGSAKVVREGAAILDVRDKETRFTDLKNYEYLASLKADTPQEHNQSSFKWTVYTGDKNTTFYDKIGLDLSYYEEDKNSIKWTILPEVKQWNDYKVQEATTTYGRRQWTVLFTQDIPVQSGPYKFVNLPGFVVKAWDSENHFVFELVDSQKVTTIWNILADEKYEKYTKAQTTKARKTAASKTYTQLMEEKGTTLSKGMADYFNKKVGDTENPIERDF